MPSKTSSRSKSSRARTSSTRRRSTAGRGKSGSSRRSPSRSRTSSGRRSSASRSKSSKGRRGATPSSRSRRSVSARGREMSSSSGTHVSTDHEFIRRWAEARGARPARVRGTGDDGAVGMLRLDFPGYGGAESLEPISWEEWFQKFDERDLALLYQDTTAGGEPSNFNTIVNRAEGESGRRSSSSSTRSPKSSTARSRRSAVRPAEPEVMEEPRWLAEEEGPLPGTRAESGARTGEPNAPLPGIEVIEVDEYIVEVPRSTSDPF